jgi:hypothetical protein
MRKVLSYIGKHQLKMQGLVLWLIALTNIMNDAFWLFAIPAVIATGMQDILDEIRKINKDDRPEIF